MSKWTESRREYYIDYSGAKHLINVTEEASSRNSGWNNFLSNVPLFAILITLIGMLLQQCNETARRQDDWEKQKQLFQLETTTATVSNIETLLSTSIKSQEFQQAKKDLFFKQYPRILLMNDTNVTRNLDTMKACILVLEGLVREWDTLYSFYQRSLHPPRLSVKNAADKTENTYQFGDPNPATTLMELEKVAQIIGPQVDSASNVFYKLQSDIEEFASLVMQREKVGLKMMIISDNLSRMNGITQEIRGIIQDRKNLLSRKLISKVRFANM